LTLAISGKEHREFLKKLGYQKEISPEDIEKHLCAYFVSDRELMVTELRDYLLKHIPHYMIPSHYKQVKTIPLMPNGKLDISALPPMDFSFNSRTGNRISARNELERKLTGVWAEILEIDKEEISMDDNFFNLGGNSLKITMMIAKIVSDIIGMDKVESTNLDIGRLIVTPTISDLAEYLKELDWEVKETVN